MKDFLFHFFLIESPTLIYFSEWRLICKIAKLQARIKPTAFCSAIDKENLIESLLDFPTLLIQLLHSLCTTFPHLSCDHHVTLCDVTL